MLTGEPPSSRITKPRHVAGALDAVLRRALAVTPRDRYPSAADFARALDEAVSGSVRRRPLFAMLLVGFLIGVGVLFAWRRTRAGADGAERVLAVLPFENLGSPEQEYFADGMADEVRGKLAGLAGLEVIGRASSTPFKRTTKPPQQIAQELGAQYLLTATVRWQKGPGGHVTVHVSPELVEVRGRSAPISKWQQSFDAEPTDILQPGLGGQGHGARAVSPRLPPRPRQRGRPLGPLSRRMGSRPVGNGAGSYPPSRPARSAVGRDSVCIGGASDLPAALRRGPRGLRQGACLRARESRSARGKGDGAARPRGPCRSASRPPNRLERR